MYSVPVGCQTVLEMTSYKLTRKCFRKTNTISQQLFTFIKFIFYLSFLPLGKLGELKKMLIKFIPTFYQICRQFCTFFMHIVCSKNLKRTIFCFRLNSHCEFLFFSNLKVLSYYCTI